MGAVSLAIAGIGQGTQFIMKLLAAHDKRVAEAKAENSAVNAALSALIHDCVLIADGFSSGALTPAASVQACLDVDAWYWQYINPYTQYHNASPARCNPNQLGDNPKIAAVGTRCWQSTQPNQASHFTAASDIGCNIVDANLGMLRAAILSLQNAKPGTSKTVSFCGWPSNKYGLIAYGGQTLKLTVPSQESPEELTISPTGILSLGEAPSGGSAVIAPGTIVGGTTQPSFTSSAAGTLGLSPTVLFLIAAGVFAAIALGGKR